MKYIKWIIAAVLVVALLIFTAVFVVSAYNTGKIGNKDLSVASDFTEDIRGVWKNTSSGTIASKIGKVRFGEDGKVTAAVLGQTVNGTYSDVYDLESKQHTLTVKGSIYGGLSIERSFTAELSEDGETLVLKDKGSSLELKLVKTDESELETKTSALTAERKTERKTETDVPKTTASVGTDFPEAIIGKWKSKLSSVSGYEFVDSSHVKISLVGVSADGTYSVYLNENSEYEIKIDYINIAGVTVSNTYIANLEGGELTLAQKNAETVSVTYVRDEA